MPKDSQENKFMKKMENIEENISWLLAREKSRDRTDYLMGLITGTLAGLWITILSAFQDFTERIVISFVFALALVLLIKSERREEHKLKIEDIKKKEIILKNYLNQ
jgi:predicted membrane channel-forming protein YqfA (hemolysin III family)